MAVRLTLTLDDNLYDRVQLLARTQQQDVAEAIATLLDETVPQAQGSEREVESVETDEAIEREIRAYHRLHAELWQRYPEQHVAIAMSKSSTTMWMALPSATVSTSVTPILLY